MYLDHHQVPIEYPNSPCICCGAACFCVLKGSGTGDSENEHYYPSYSSQLHRPEFHHWVVQEPEPQNMLYIHPPKPRLSVLLTSIDQMVHLVLWSTGWTQELFCFKFCLWFSGWNCHVLLLSRFCVWARRRRVTEKIPESMLGKPDTFSSQESGQRSPPHPAEVWVQVNSVKKLPTTKWSKPLQLMWPQCGQGDCTRVWGRWWLPTRIRTIHWVKGRDGWSFGSTRLASPFWYCLYFFQVFPSPIWTCVMLIRCFAQLFHINIIPLNLPLWSGGGLAITKGFCSKPLISRYIKRSCRQKISI